MRLRCFLAAGLCWLAGCGAPAPERALPDTAKTNLLIVTFDTLRADHLGAYGSARAHTPVLDRLARDGALWQEAETAVPLTLPSHATMFTGLYPFQHGVRNNGFYHLDPRFETLAERLSEAGFETAAFIGGFPLQAKFGLNQGFGVYEDHLSRDEAGSFSHAERPASEVVEAFFRWHQSRKSQGRFFAWLHFYDPHAEYEPPAPFGAALEGRLYDGEIAFTDAQLGRVLAALQAGGELQDTLVLAVADHGESLGEHGEGTHSVFVYGATIRVPLLVWHKSLAVRGRIVTGLARTADLYPTLLDLYGLEAAQTSGQSLLPPLLGAEPAETASYSESLLPSIQFGWGQLLALRRGHRRYIRTVRPELYDLAADPAELHNLVPDPRTDALEAELAELLATAPADAETGSGAELSAAEREALESLGYVMARPGAAASAGTVPDPKDQIGLYERLQAGLRLAAVGRYAEAAPALEAVVADDPANVYAKKRLAEVEHHLGRSRQAIERLAPLVQGSVIDAELLATLGRIRRDTGDLAGAARDLEAAHKLNPRYAAVRFDLGQVELRRGRPAEARKLFEEVLAEQPDYAPAHAELGHLELGQGAEEAALTHYERAIGLQSGLAPAWMGKGKALYGLRRLAEAVQAFERAHELAPRDAGVDFELGRALLELGEAARAVEPLRRSLAVNPEDARSRHALGNALAAQGDLTGAYQELQAAARQAPEDGAIQQDLGVVCSRLERLAEAVEHLEHARALLPGSALVQNSLGAAYGRGGDLEKARGAFEEALRLDPAYVSAHLNLAGVLEALGQPEEARRHQQQAAELGVKP